MPELFTLVSHVSITWNSFLPYLVKLTDRLEDLGFQYIDDNVTAPKEEADEKRHVISKPSYEPYIFTT